MDKEKKKIGSLPIDEMKQEVNDFIEEVRENEPVLTDSFESIESPEHSEAIIDEERKILSYRRKKDGIKVESVGFETPSVKTDEVNTENLEVNHAVINGGDATLDSLNLSEEGMTEFQQALKDAGFRPGGAGDWSDYISNKGKDPLTIPVPRLAYVNFTNADGNLTWPTTKTSDFEAIMEFSDMQGNYFKKNIIFNAQGNSSMAFIKKNGSVKMFDSSVYNSKGKKGKGDKFGLKFGDWVSQTTYHLKAFYTDFFKGVSYIAYQIALEVQNTRGIMNDRTWKKALLSGYQFTDNQFENPQINDMNIQIDNGALCQPDGFPCIVYLNGAFYGIYVWLIKKDAANFNMSDKEEHIHLDGRLDNGSIFAANGDASAMDWNPMSSGGFEVRNPEDLVCMFPYTKDGEDCWEYNADVDANQELAGIRSLSESIPQYNSGTPYAKSVIVGLNGRVYLSKVANNAGHNPEDAISTKHAKAIDNSTDYWIDVTFTNKVKTYILRLSNYNNEINSELTIEAKKALFEQYFDLENMIDYELVQVAVSDGDGFSKNWQWTTWDGVKWFVNNYDKDCSFGNSPSGILTGSVPTDPMTTWPKGWAGQTQFLAENYETELNSRWIELVNKGIFTKEHFNELFKKWVQRIGSINYSKEYSKWNEAPCCRDSGINTDYWKIVSLEYVSHPHTTYDATHHYALGDTCVIAVGSYNTTFECVAENGCTGENPISKTYSYNPTMLGYRDNLWRVLVFIEKNFIRINNFANN